MISELTKRLCDKINWIEVPVEITYEKLHKYICDAIRQLYLATGRFDLDPDLYLSKENCEFMLNPDEQEWVLLTAWYDVVKWVKDEKESMISYTLDARMVLHHDDIEMRDMYLAPETQMMEIIEKQRQVVWMRMMVFKGV